MHSNESGLAVTLPEDPNRGVAAEPIPFPHMGDPGFWNLLGQWIVIELRYGVNWMTFIPALMAGYTAFQMHLINTNVSVVIMALLFGLNAFLRTNQQTSNMAKAYARAYANEGCTLGISAAYDDYSRHEDVHARVPGL